jgi:hypothetical protein
MADSCTMNRTFNLGLVAASIVLLSQPLHANDDQKSDDKGKKGDGGKHAAVPAAHAGRAPNAAVTKAPAPHFATQAPQQFHTQKSAPVIQSQQFHSKNSAPVVQSRPQTVPAPTASRARSFSQPQQQRNAPSVAVGGATNQYSNAPVYAQRSRSYAGYQGGASNYQPSVSVSRSWDRGSSHTWNHHHYRWNDGNWVIIDSGAYGYSYGYDNGYNAGRMYDSQSLAASVQVRLARQGYDPGPADGVIGGQTRQAIADFQNDHRLPVTGRIDGPLLQTMGLN